MSFESVSAESLLTPSLSGKSICVSSNRFTTEDFGFDDWFDRSVSIGRTRYFSSGADTRAISDPRTLLNLSIETNNTVSTLLNGAITKAGTLLDRSPIPSLLDDGGGRVVKAALNEVRSADDFFLFTNFMDAHTPHRLFRGHDRNLVSAPNSWTSSHIDIEELNMSEEKPTDLIPEDLKYYRELYHASVEYLDRLVSSFIERLQEHSSQPLVTIVTADHGENLGFETEDYLMGHSSSLSEALLQVPFLLIDPEQVCPVESVDRISHLDLKPMIESIVANEEVEFSRSKGLAEVVGGGLLNGHSEYLDRIIRCAYCYNTDRKFVWNSLDQCRTCSIDVDRPSWQSCRSDSSIPDWCLEQFESDMSAVKDGSDESANIDENVRRGLEDLGYL